MTADDWQIIRFTLLVSTLSTLLILPFGVGLAWLLARKVWPAKSLVETAVSLPLVMPPVATGLILLQLFGRKGPLGKYLEDIFHLEIVFTWKAVVLALSVMSFPLLVRSIRVAFEQVDTRLEQVARTLGKSSWQVFWRVSLPLAARGIATGVVLAFARAVGEFGATILVAGGIPGKTMTLSVAIYQLIQLGQDSDALRLLAASILFSFGSLWLSEILLKEKGRAL